MKTDERLEVDAYKMFRHPSDYIGVFVDRIGRDVVSTAEPLVFKERELYVEDNTPTFSMDKNAAQKFMDDLWNCGLRPSEGSGSAGAMKAVEKHLADMRKITFNRLKIDN